MKKFFKTLLIILILFMTIAAGIYAYVYFSKSETHNALSVIPEDAVFIIETNNLTKGWNTISESKMWQHLINTKYFRDINQSAASVDSLIKGNKTLDMLLSNRQLLMSLHMTSGISYDFIFTIDLQETSKISFLKNYLKEIARWFDYEITYDKFESYEIISLRNLEDNEMIYISIIDNLLVCSFSKYLIENAILQKAKPGWKMNEKFQEVALDINSRNLLSLYVNYDNFDKYIKIFMSDEEENLSYISRNLRYTAFNFDVEEEKLRLEGSTNIYDSLSSYFNAMLNVQPGKMFAHKIITDKAALYLSICFDDFYQFMEQLENEYASTSTEDYESYSKRVRKIENLFKVDLEKDFFDWIGNEIALVKTRPTANAREQDVIVVFHSKDIDLAKEGLNHFAEQIKKKSPAKIETADYLNYQIHYLNIKGFFKLFFGKLFGTLEKPYYTFIDDFVVFSNSPTIIMDFINDYMKGNTLSHEEAFTDFKDEFEVKSNISAFVRTPKLYSHLYYYSKKDKRKGIQDNKEIIVSFARIGIQFSSDGRKFNSILMAEFDEDALADEEMEQFEAAAEDLYNKEFEALNFKVLAEDSLMPDEGDFKLYYSDSSLMCEGKIESGKVDGLVRTYYKSGNIQSSIPYTEGKIIGKALFYYDNEMNSIKARVNYEGDLIVDEYMEFYENGARKALLEYKEGYANGKAEYYYESGIIKMEGKFKNGVKKGKWKHYSETGQLMDKERWR